MRVRFQIAAQVELPYPKRIKLFQMAAKISKCALNDDDGLTAFAVNPII